MNRYGEKYGIHTPQLTEEIHKLMNKDTKLQWDDVSWHNDELDSLRHEIKSSDNEHEFIELYIPNPMIDDDGHTYYNGCNNYSIWNWERECLHISEDIDGIIVWINKNY